MGLLSKQKVEARLRECEKQQLRQVSGTGKGHKDTKKFEFKKEHKKYDSGADFVFGENSEKPQSPGKKRKLDTSVVTEEMDTTLEVVGETGSKKKKKKKNLD